MTKSNTITITVAGAAPVITISASTTSLPASGGSVTFSGTTDYPAGTVLYLWESTPGATFVYTGISATVSSTGTYSMPTPINIPANSSAGTQNYAFFTGNSSSSSNVQSPQVAVAVAGAPSISISASSTSLPATGGTVTITGTSNYGTGQSMYLFYNGSNTGTTTTSSTGGFSFSQPVPANSSTVAVSDSVYVSDNSAGT